MHCFPAWQNEQKWLCAQRRLRLAEPSTQSDQSLRNWTASRNGRSLAYLFNTQRRLWSNCADVQADLSLRWAQLLFSCFCHNAAQITSSTELHHIVIRITKLNDQNSVFLKLWWCCRNWFLIIDRFENYTRIYCIFKHYSITFHFLFVLYQFYLTSVLQPVTDSFFTRNAFTCEHFFFFKVIIENSICEDRPCRVNKNACEILRINLMNLETLKYTNFIPW